MKKILSAFVVCALIFVTSCSAPPTSEQTSVPATDVSELSARIGIEMSLPETATNVECYIINNLIGETQFSYNGIMFVHRVSKAYSDSALYGIPERKTKTDTFKIKNETEVTVYNFKNGQTVALWYENGNHHSLYSVKTIGTDLISEICEKL